MRMNRKTAMAGAAMSVASLVSATFAVAATMDLPVLGFGGSSGAVTTTEPVPAGTDRLATTTAAAAVPVVVEQVVYEDVYERVARPTVPRDAASAEPASTMAAAAPTKPVVAPTTTVTTTTRGKTAAPTTTRVATTSTRATTTRPSPPRDCDEPEWDREHQTWHCKGD